MEGPDGAWTCSAEKIRGAWVYGDLMVIFLVMFMVMFMVIQYDLMGFYAVFNGIWWSFNAILWSFNGILGRFKGEFMGSVCIYNYPVVNGRITPL